MDCQASLNPCRQCLRRAQRKQCHSLCKANPTTSDIFRNSLQNPKLKLIRSVSEKRPMRFNFELWKDLWKTSLEVGLAVLLRLSLQALDQQPIIWSREFSRILQEFATATLFLRKINESNMQYWKKKSFVKLHVTMGHGHWLWHSTGKVQMHLW